MSNIKLLIDKLFLTKIEKFNPKIYRFLTYDLYKQFYSPIINMFRYKDKYFFEKYRRFSGYFVLAGIGCVI